MNQNDITIATMTWARDAQEEKLLRESLPLLAEMEMPVFVTDAGSGEEFLSFLRGFPNFTVFEADKPGLWPQIRRSLMAAHESERAFIFYTESDKRDFFRDHLIQFLADAPDDENIGVALATRSAASFATFPAFQQYTETTINRCCAEVTGKKFDFTYGPFLLNRHLVPHFPGAENNIGWAWRSFAFGLASRSGYRIEQIIGEFPCPAEQREDSKKDRLYRMRQLSEHLEGLLLATA
jgi:hypothetical protein